MFVHAKKNRNTTLVGIIRGASVPTSMHFLTEPGRNLLTLAFWPVTAQPLFTFACCVLCGCNLCVSVLLHFAFGCHTLGALLQLQLVILQRWRELGSCKLLVMIVYCMQD